MTTGYSVLQDEANAKVRKRRAPKIQWRGAISKKGKDLKFTAAKILKSRMYSRVFLLNGYSRNNGHVRKSR
jgi:hypothetical protein